jgi:hypothetical protein
MKVLERVVDLIIGNDTAKSMINEVADIINEVDPSRHHNPPTDDQSARNASTQSATESANPYTRIEPNDPDIKRKMLLLDTAAIKQSIFAYSTYTREERKFKIKFNDRTIDAWFVSLQNDPNDATLRVCINDPSTIEHCVTAVKEKDLQGNDDKDILWRNIHSWFEYGIKSMDALINDGEMILTCVVQRNQVGPFTFKFIISKNPSEGRSWAEILGQ